jgi:hypothetical protein
LATVSSCEALTTLVPVLPSFDRAVSILVRSRRWSARTFRAGGIASTASAIVVFSLPSRLASRSTAFSARTMSRRWSSRPPMKVSSSLSRDLTRFSRPSRALFSSVVIVLSWATPPPLSSADSADSTSSTSGLRPLRDKGITSPSRSRPTGVPSGGSASATYFSPSMLVCRSPATALAGSFTESATRRRTLACQPSSSTFSTAPTVTLSTLTADCGTRSRTSRNSTVTW